MKLTYREQDTMLAALRYYQEALEAGRVPGYILDIADDDGDDDSLDTDEIDDLCERLNGVGE